MSTPTYGGSAIFGRSVEMKTINEPSEEQINHFFGLVGSERIHGGLSGRVTMVRGSIIGSTESNFRVAREALRSYDDGVARTLTDTVGTTWENVVVRNFDPGDRISRDSRGWHCRYQMTFRHLT